MITSASKLAEMKTVRCGVIPYTIVPEFLLGYDKTFEESYSIRYLLARDTPTKELGDLGGGVRKLEFSLMAGFREFHEESRGIFSDTYKTVNDISTCLAFVDGNKMAVIFVPVEPKWLSEAQRLFSERETTKKRSNEICELVWVDENKFKSLIHGFNRKGGDIMWKKIRTFFSNLYKNKEFSDTLKKIAMVSWIDPTLV